MKAALVLCVCLLAVLATASEEHEDQFDSVEDVDFASRKLAAANEDYKDQIEAVQDDGLASRMLLGDSGSFVRPGKPFGPRPRRPGRPFPFKPGRPGPKPFGPKKPFRGLKLAGDSEEHENEIEAVQSDGLTSRQLLDDFSSFGRPGKPFGPKPRRPGRPFPFKPGRPGPKPFGPKKPFRGLKLAGDNVEHEGEIEAVQDDGFTSRQLLDDFGSFGRPGKPFGPKPRRPGRPFPFKPGRPGPKPFGPKKPFRGLKHAGEHVEHEGEIEAVQDDGFSWRQLLGKPFGRKPGPKPPKKPFPRRPFPGKKHG